MELLFVTEIKLCSLVGGVKSSAVECKQGRGGGVGRWTSGSTLLAGYRMCLRTLKQIVTQILRMPIMSFLCSK